MEYPRFFSFVSSSDVFAEQMRPCHIPLLLTELLSRLHVFGALISVIWAFTRVVSRHRNFAVRRWNVVYAKLHS